MSNIQKNLLKSRLPPLPPKHESNLRKGVVSRQKDYNPIEWKEYFEEQKDVVTSQGSFHVYLSKKPPTDAFPLVVCLHGGGYSGLSWSHFSAEITELVHCQCLAIDLRGHGASNTTDEEDLSAETQAADVISIIQALYPDNCPDLILIGHSMGGAICVHVAAREELHTLLGVVVIDVVEGTAMEALASMQSFLRSRPTHFKSIQHAIEWSVRSGQIRNVQSAKVSMPGQIVNCQTGLLATNDITEAESESTPIGTSFDNPLSIPEDEELETPAEKVPRFQIPVLEDPKKYVWRIDLSKSETHWSGWFQGLSEKFLNLRATKLLLLAGIDSLDRTLTVGQMQGKFQMQVLARCGHAVHEDLPHEVAEVVGSYMLRNKFATEASEFTQRMPAC